MLKSKRFLSFAVGMALMLSACGSTGSRTSACKECEGTGKVEVVLGCYGCNNGVSIYTGGICQQCGGSGQVVYELSCGKCGGDGIIGNESKENSAPLPSGSGVNPGIGIPSSSASCPTCGGFGEKLCPSCDGMGYLSKTRYAPDFGGSGNSSYQTQQKCYACGGSGSVPCTSCGGDGQL